MRQRRERFDSANATRRRMALDSFSTIAVEVGGRALRSAKVDARHRLNSPSITVAAIDRAVAWRGESKQRSPISSFYAGGSEGVLLKLASASPFRPPRNLSPFAFRLSLFSCHCFGKDAQFAAQGGITGFVLTVRGLDNWQPRPRRSRRRRRRRRRNAQPLRRKRLRGRAPPRRRLRASPPRKRRL